MVKPPKAAQRYKNGDGPVPERNVTSIERFRQTACSAPFFSNPSSCPRKRVTLETLRSKKKGDTALSLSIESYQYGTLEFW